MIPIGGLSDVMFFFFFGEEGKNCPSLLNEFLKASFWELYCHFWRGW